MANPKLKEKIAELPASPGVYIMKKSLIDFSLYFSKTNLGKNNLWQTQN